MKAFVAFLMYFAALTAHATLPAPGQPGAVNDLRYCGEPQRNGDGTIHRSVTQLRHFVSVFPCPATLVPSTSCPGWSIDHIIPLSTGGCDAPVNMIWLPDQLKSCAGKVCVDRWERQYHAVPRQKVSLQ